MKGWIEVHEISNRGEGGDVTRKRSIQIAAICWVAVDKHRTDRGCLQNMGSSDYVVYTLESYPKLLKLIEEAQ